MYFDHQTLSQSHGDVVFQALSSVDLAFQALSQPLVDVIIAF